MTEDLSYPKVKQMLNASTARILFTESVRDEAGKIVDFVFKALNQTAGDVNGIFSEELIGKRLLQLFPEEEDVFFNKYVAVVETGKPLRVERHYPNRHVGKDTWFDVLVVKNGDGFVMNTEDITERKKAEQEISRSRELLKTTIDSSLDMIQVFEAVRNGQGEIVDFKWALNNEAAERIYGNVIGKSLLTLNPGVVEEGIFDTFKRVAETGIPDQRERHYVHEQFNGWFYQSTVKQNDGVATTTRDITEQKKAEQELLRLKDEVAQKATDKYLTLFNSINQGFCTIENLYDENDKPTDYRFLEISSSFEQQTGIKNGSGKRMKEIAPDQDEFWFETYGRIGKTREPERFEYFSTPLGKWWSVHAFPIDEPELRRIGVLFDDITERKRHEQHLSLLTEISKELVELITIDETVRTLSEKIGTYFQVSWCIFAERDGDTAVATCGWNKESVASIQGTYRMGDFLTEEQLAVNNAGIQTIVTDVETGPNVNAATYGVPGIRSFIITPLAHKGKWHFQLSIIDTKPRHWRQDEIEMMQEIAGRVWTRLERARAEEALRINEERTRIQKEAFQSAVNGEPLASSLNILTRIVKQQLGSDVRTAFYLAYPDGASLHAIDGAGDMPKTYTAPIDGFPVSEQSFCSGYAIATGRPALTRDVFEDPLWQPYLHLASAHNFRSCSSYPILTREGKAVGSFAMYFTGVHEATSQEHAVADAVTQAAAIILSRHAEALERSRAEEALHESEEKFRTLFTTMEQGFCIIEKVDTPEGEPSDYRYIITNPAFERHTRMKDVVGKTILQLVPGAERRIMDVYDEAVATQEHCHIVDYVSALDLWVEADIYPTQMPVQIAVLFSNITARKKSEMALRESEDRFRSLVTATSNSVYKMSADWKLMYNLQGKDFLADTSNTESSWIEKYIPGWERERVQQAIKEAIENKKIFELEHQLFDAGGNIAWVYSRAIPKLNDQGEIVEWIGAGNNITRRKEAEIVLRESEEQKALLLKLSDQLQTISDPIEMQDAAMQLLGEHLGLSRAYYFRAERDEQGWVHVIENAYQQGQEQPEMRGSHSLKSFGSRLFDGLDKGKVINVPDIEAVAELKEEELAAFRAIGIAAFLNVPLLKNGTFRVGIAIHSTVPRKWKPAEIDLIREVAHRTWNAVERIRAEEALRASESRFRTLTNAVPQVIWTNDPEGKANYFNQRWYEYTGLTFEQSAGPGWQAVVHPDDAPASAEKWEKALAAAEIFDSEYRLRRHDGAYCWFIGRNVPLKDEAGNVAGWFGSATDIQDLKEVQEALSQSEERLRITMETATDYAIITMDTERRIEKWSSGALKVFGYTEDEVKGLTADLIFTEEERSAGAPQKEMETARNTGRASDERWHQRKDGSRFYASGVMRPILNNELTGYVKVLRDVTQQQLFTEELHKLVAERTVELQRSNEDLRQFAHVASHDLKEPVRKIKTFNNRIIEDFGDALPGKVKTYLNKIGSSADRMFAMIEGVLNYSKMGNTERPVEAVDLNEVIREIESDLEVLIKQKNGQIIRNNLPHLSGYRVLLYQLFYNLILNSLKFTKTSEASLINITCEVTKKEEKEFYKIVLSDNGIGFEQEYAQDIFKTFTRLHSADDYEGTGLGLALCKKIVERHGGSILATGNPGVGASFTIMLPANK